MIFDFGIATMAAAVASAVAAKSAAEQGHAADLADLAHTDCVAFELSRPPLRLNCRNCGAPHEPVECSYCRSPA